MDKWLFYFFDFNRRSPGGKKDPETLRREAICEALDSLVEKEGRQQISKMPVAKVFETSESREQNGSGFLVEEQSNARVTGSRGVKGGRGVTNMSSRGVEKEKKRGNGSFLQAGRADNKETSGTEKDDLKPVSRRGKWLNRRDRGGGFAKQNLN